MTLKFADPGYDWTIHIVFGSILVGILLISVLFLLMHYLRSTKYSPFKTISGWTAVAAIIWTVIPGLMVSPAVGSQIYQDRVDVALYDALEAEGFDQIEMEYETRGYTQTLTGTLDGKPFKGTITDLRYPKDYTYKIKEDK